MIEASVGPYESLERIVEELQRLQDPDLMPLALDLKEAIVQGNREGLLAGTDGDGVPFAPLKPSTYKRGRGGLGPPLIPRYNASQLIDRFRVEIQPGGVEGVRLKATWPGVPQLKYFKTGTKHMARRNPSGIRPATRKKIEQIIVAYKKRLVAKF